MILIHNGSKIEDKSNQNVIFCVMFWIILAFLWRDGQGQIQIFLNTYFDSIQAFNACFYEL